MILPALLGMLLLAAQAGDSERNFTLLQVPVYAFGKQGTGPGAFQAPRGVAVGKDERLFVADSGNHRIQVFTLDGTLRASFGNDELLFPGPLAAAPDGSLYAADLGHGRMLKFGPGGELLRRWGQRGNGAGDFGAPGGLVVSGGKLYVSDAALHRIQVFSADGQLLKSFGDFGAAPGQFKEPAGIGADADGAIYVADSGNHRIQKLDPDGRPLAQWGAWGAHAGLLSFPQGLAVWGERVYVADSGNHRIQVFDRGGVFLRQWGAAPPQPREGGGRLHFPGALALAPSGGSTIVAEPGEHRIQVFANRETTRMARVNDVPWWDGLHARLHALRLAPPPVGAPPQVFAAVAAADVHAVYFFDVSSEALGPLATAGGYGRKLGEFNHVGGLATDPTAGRAWVADCGNRRLQLLELPRDKERPELFSGIVRVVSTFALERVPGALAIDARRNLYIADPVRGAVDVFDPALASLRSLAVGGRIPGFAVSPDGGIVVADPDRFQVRGFGPDGRSRFAWGRRGESGDDAFLEPAGVAIGDDGAVYVSDRLLHDVRKFSPEGKLLLRIGGPGRAPEQLCGPGALAFEKPGRLIVEDTGNHRAQVYASDGRYIGAYVTGGLTSPMGVR